MRILWSRLWKLEGNKPEGGETYTKVWSSTHVKKAVCRRKVEQLWDLLFSSAFSSNQLKIKQPIGHGANSLLFSVSVDKSLKIKKYVWDFTQEVGKGCVAFNELFRQS